MIFEEIDLKLFHEDTYSGYWYIEAPNHELSTPCGRMYMHRYLMAQKIGRKLGTLEHVHHIDHDRGNNSLDNLELLSNTDHMMLHLLERYGEGLGKTSTECACCGGKIVRTNVSLSRVKYGVFCNRVCQGEYFRKFNISKDVLFELVWTLPTDIVAETLGVSDNAVARRCKILGVDKPPRGYWQKIRKPSLGVKKKILEECSCVLCGNTFMPTLDQMRKSKRSIHSGPFCSRSCTGKYGQAVRANKSKEQWACRQIGESQQT